MRLDSLSSVKTNNSIKKTNFRVCKNTEKLASGLQINKSADNAAGLAISEKMRSIIRGLNQSHDNTNEGIDLVNVGEGALGEVHSILQRIREMAVQSANATYMDEVDREALQSELDALRYEVDRIAGSTEFNGIKLFQDEGYDSEYELTGYWSRFNTMFDDIYSSTRYMETPLQTLLTQTKPGETNIIYTEIIHDFTTTQQPDGSNSFTGTDKTLADTLKASIVPNVVSSIVSRYPAFSYLNGTNLGIGLNLYSDASSSTLAYVRAGAGISAGTGFKHYQLAVNTAKVDLSTEAGRSDLERTIAHEMVHAFMDEAMASGMFGAADDGASVTRFPMWFIEGMAQTASGPGNWVEHGLGLDESSTAADISAALAQTDAKLSLSASSTLAQYGTGYLASMYLGYKAYTSDGGTVNMDSPSLSASAISTGVSRVLFDITAGNSLSDTIAKYTDYASLSDFESGFANDDDIIQFIQELLKYTADGKGGLVSGDLADTNPVPNNDLTGIKLFELNPDNQTVKNFYPDDVNIFSGGSAIDGGVPPIDSLVPPDEDVPTVMYPIDVFTVTGGTEGVDWKFDTTTGVLNILTGADMTISGGSKDGTYFGRIVIADNIGDVNITLDEVNIDMTMEDGTHSGIYTGDGNNVNLTLKDGSTSTVMGGGRAAGIQLSEGGAGTTLVINGNGELNVYGGSESFYGGAAIGNSYGKGGYGNNIIINSGTINAEGGYGAAAIGAAERSNLGDITINGGDITAIADHHGAGIGGGWTPSNIGNITITGGNILASGVEHGTGIGGGCRGTVGDITISGDDTVVVALGGHEGAAIGASWEGKAGTITIDGGTVTATGGRKGAGIGSGLDATGGDIIINGGTVTATGATDAAGIGSGRGASNTGIYINGGTVTATGGLTNGGGNIGAYLPQADKSAPPEAAPLEIAPGLTIKAGESGEGLYNTTGAVSPDGTPIFSFKLDSSLLPDGFTFPVSAQTTTGMSFSWDDLKHMDEDAVYIWMNGEDHILEVTDANGNTATLDLVFHPGAGVWKLRGEPAPPDAEKPEYSDGVVPPDYPGKPVPNPVPEKEQPVACKGIILQIGAYSENIFVVPQFYFSAKALKMGELDISTRPAANDTIDKVNGMVKRVSMMRSTYGAITNCLEHTVSNLVNTAENTTAAESQIRDADMATEMVEYTKNNILAQASQAILAQTNGNMSKLLSIIQQ